MAVGGEFSGTRCFLDSASRAPLPCTMRWAGKPSSCCLSNKSLRQVPWVTLKLQLPAVIVTVHGGFQLGSDTSARGTEGRRAQRVPVGGDQLAVGNINPAASSEQSLQRGRGRSLRSGERAEEGGCRRTFCSELVHLPQALPGSTMPSRRGEPGQRRGSAATSAGGGS